MRLNGTKTHTHTVPGLLTDGTVFIKADTLVLVLEHFCVNVESFTHFVDLGNVCVNVNLLLLEDTRYREF